MRWREWSAWALVALSPCCWGCAGAPTAPASKIEGAGDGLRLRFPNRAALQKIAARRPGPLSWPRVASVEGWALELPGVEAPPLPAPLEALLSESAPIRAGHARITPEVRCVAGEIARFLAEEGASPTPSLERFIAGRCGAPGTRLSVRHLTGAAPADTGLDEIAAQWAANLKGLMVGVASADAPALVGLAVARHEGRVAFARVSLPEVVSLSRVDRTPSGAGTVRVEGALLEVAGPVGTIEAAVTRGAYEVTACWPEVEGRRFAFECPVDAGDPSAWLSITHQPPGGLIGQLVAEALVWPGGQPARRYQRAQPPSPDAEVASPEALPEALTEAINRLRLAGGRAPLSLNVEQGRALGELAPHFFSPGAGEGADEVPSRIALGALAGWSVKGEVSQGRFLARRHPGRALAPLVESLMALPHTRRVLMDEAATLIAVGGVVQQGIAALVTTYAPGEPPGLEAEVLQHLTAARGEAPLARLPEVEAASAEIVQRMQAGGLTPEGALSAVMEITRTSLNARVRGVVWVGSEVARMPLPPPISAAEVGQAAIVTGRYTPPGSPWSQRVALVVWPEEGF